MDPLHIDQAALHRRASFVEEEVVQRSDEFRTAAPLAALSTRLHSAAVRGELRRLLFHSVVFAVVIPCLFSLSGGEPVLAGWTLSLFVIIYLSCFAVSYSTPSTPLGKMLFSLSYLVLLASCVGSLVSSVLGMVFIYMDSILAAGFFGSVLAQHREGERSEMAAFLAVAKAPPGKYRRQLGIYLFLAILAMFYAICWVMRPEGDYDALHVAMNLFGAIAVLLFIQTTCVLGWLNGAVFGADSSPPVVPSYSTIAILFVASYLLAGEIVAVTVLWLCVLASAAYLGYYLRVHATYEELMMIRNVMQAHTTVGSSATTQSSPAAASSSATKDKCD